MIVSPSRRFSINYTKGRKNQGFRSVEGVFLFPPFLCSLVHGPFRVSLHGMVEGDEEICSRDFEHRNVPEAVQVVAILMMPWEGNTTDDMLLLLFLLLLLVGCLSRNNTDLNLMASSR